MQSTLQETIRKSEIAGVLERICQALELSDTQQELAKRRYETVGNWLADADHPLLQALVTYPQGSMSLGTTVKPIGQNEHDVDLVGFVPGLGPQLPPAELKRAIGERLQANAEPVNPGETSWLGNYSAGTTSVGLLIQATAGSCGGTGGWRTKRSG